MLGGYRKSTIKRNRNVANLNEDCSYVLQVVEVLNCQNLLCYRCTSRYHAISAESVRLSPCKPLWSLLKWGLSHFSDWTRIESDLQTTMRAFFNWPCSPLSLGAALPLLAGVLLAPASARAGCGDHVVVIAAPEDDVSTFAPISPMIPAKKHVPCSGPHCSGSPLAPTPAPAVPIETGGSDAARILEPLLLPASQSSPHPWESPRPTPLLIASSVYHPPR